MTTFDITSVRTDTITSIDAGSLYIGSSADFNRWRAEEDWLATVKDRLSEVLASPSVVREQPEVALATLKTRGTFASSRTEKLFPLRVSPPNLESCPIRIGSRGCISVRCRSEHDFGVKNAPGRIVDWHSSEQARVENETKARLEWFVEVWNRALPEFKLEAEIDDALSASGYRYEIVDVEAICLDAQGAATPIKDLYESTDVEGLRGLAGLSRMARENSWKNYSPRALESLRSADLGSRVDEAWIVNQDRILRSFQEGRSDAEIAAFMRDLDLAVELVCQERATLAYLNESLQNIQAATRRTTTARTMADESARRNLQSLLHESSILAQLLGDPLTLRREAKHSFIGRLIGVVASEIGAIEAWAACRESATAATNTISSELSLLASESQLELGVQARRTNRGIYALTLATLLVGAAALIGSLTADDVELRLLPPVEGASTSRAADLLKGSSYAVEFADSCEPRSSASRQELRVSEVKIGDATVSGLPPGSVSYPEGTLTELVCQSHR